MVGKTTTTTILMKATTTTTTSMAGKTTTTTILRTLADKHNEFAEQVDVTEETFGVINDRADEHALDSQLEDVLSPRVENIVGKMPSQIHKMIKLKMQPGQTSSVGFEFECANKAFHLTQSLPWFYQGSCPEIALPVSFRAEAKPHDMLPLIFGLNSEDIDYLDMKNFPQMNEVVQNVVWTKDAYHGFKGPDCEELAHPMPVKLLRERGRGPIVPLYRNNNSCWCSYSLEFKTLPLKSEQDVKEAMVGAGLMLAEASKKERDLPFEGWNVKHIVQMGAKFNESTSFDPCMGSSHVTKAFEVNKNSLKAMLKQQKYIFCEVGASKESAGDQVFRTSFPEAYMLWRAQQECSDSSCFETTTLGGMCLKHWSSPTSVIADIEKHLFTPKEKRDSWWFEWKAENVEDPYDVPCSPGILMTMLCFDGESEATVDEDILKSPDYGFGFHQEGLYYGPGGAKNSGDTTTKVNAMISADGSMLYGLAEHRKDLFNTRKFRPCIYDNLLRIFRNTRKSEEDKLKKAFALFDRKKGNCANALAETMKNHNFK
mmetsp:Transcript_123413/g.195706  ORF Transcript_123413/g.195706 Transcript_123413/m.195706 type:complete len:542 (+) Transcript_123413:718-2343(+)